MNLLMRWVKAGIIVSLLLVWTLPVMAQPDELPRQPVGARGFFITGLTQLDISSLNNALAATGYPRMSKNFISFGGGGWVMRGKLLLGGEGHGLTNRSQDTGDNRYRISMAGGYGLFNLGYVVRAGMSNAVYVIAGFGGGGFSFKITENQSVDFYDVLREPGRSATMATGGLITSISLGLDHFLLKRPGRRANRGLLIGVQLGYLFTPLKSDWQLEHVKVAGGPSVGIDGPFIRLMIGGGRFYAPRKRMLN